MLRSGFRRLAAVLAVVLLASACSSDTSSGTAGSPTSAETGTQPAQVLSAEEYGKGACTAMTDSMVAIQSRSTDIFPLPSGDAEAAKSAVLDFLDGVIADMDAAVSTVDGLGPPTRPTARPRTKRW